MKETSHFDRTLPKVTSNKIVQKKRNHFLAKLFMAFNVNGMIHFVSIVSRGNHHLNKILFQCFLKLIRVTKMDQTM